MEYKGLFNVKYPQDIAKRFGDDFRDVVMRTLPDNVIDSNGWFWVMISGKWLLTCKY